MQFAHFVRRKLVTCQRPRLKTVLCPLNPIPEHIEKEALALGYDIASREALGLHMFNLNRLANKYELPMWRSGFGATFDEAGCRAFYSQSAKTIKLGPERFIEFLVAFKNCGNDLRLLSQFQEAGSNEV